MPNKVLIATAGLVLFVAQWGFAADATDWRSWRGPLGNGSIEQGTYPTKFDSEKYLWRTQLPGKGCSTPIILKEMIYLTSPAEGNDALLCYDSKGTEKWRAVFGKENAGKHRNGSGSNASPVTDGEAVFVFFKSGTFAAVELNGKVRWKTDLVERFGKDTLYWDHGTSPVLTEKHVIMARMHEGESWLAAFDKVSGDIAWKVARNFKTPRECDHGYTTPLVIQHQGRESILVWGGEHLTIHNATDGQVSWSCGNFNPDASQLWPAIATPVIVGDMAVIAYGRNDRGIPRLHGIRLTGSGDVTATNHVWKRDDVGTFVPTPVAYKGRVILVGDKGEAESIDPVTGKTIWKGAFPKSRSNFYASPLVAGDKLFAPREDGVVFVASISNDKFDLLSENNMAESVIGSPVPATNRLLLRGEKHLFCIAPDSPYSNALLAEPPYFRVRYEGSSQPGELVYPVSFTVWIPPTVKTLRGLIVHQHGCGEGSCKSGQTGAFDWHWQALAKKHDCALISPVYEQPEKADCQLWCDPRNGSDAAFQKSLTELGAMSNHPELATVPWAIWGHSGGGHWAGGMTLLHPDRVAAAWLRSGVPPITAAEGKPAPYTVSDAACQVPVMINLGTKEGVTDKASRFSGVWPGNEAFFLAVRAKRGLIGVSIDPLSSHDCGNQRYLAMPWFDASLTARLPAKNGDPLKPMSSKDGWLAPLNAGETNVVAPVPAAKFEGALEKSVWLPSESVAVAWTQYVKDSAVTDTTPPPAPTNLRVAGNVLTWSADADLESGLASFIIERDGQFLANFPEQGQAKNPFGRPIFQNLSYSDTPAQPLAEMRFTDTKAEAGKTHQYRIITVNTVGLKSK